MLQPRVRDLATVVIYRGDMLATICHNVLHVTGRRYGQVLLAGVTGRDAWVLCRLAIPATPVS